VSTHHLLIQAECMKEFDGPHVGRILHSHPRLTLCECKDAITVELGVTRRAWISVGMIAKRSRARGGHGVFCGRLRERNIT
jgi:hypothetical protein